jgi:hypothetical protein
MIKALESELMFVDGGALLWSRFDLSANTQHRQFGRPRRAATR